MSARTINPGQAFVLRALLSGRPVHTGRQGHPTPTLRALERRGLVEVAATHVWETDWRLTPAGRVAAAALGGES